MKNSVFGSVFLIVCIFCFYEALAITCFKCNSNESEQCVGEPDELPASSKAECKGYCTIVRTEHTDIPGVVVTLVRDCEDKPHVLNDVRTDKHYTKMYTSCDNADRCNSGDGKREPNDSDGSRTGPKDVIVVDEISSSWIKKPSLIFTIGTIFIYMFH